MHQGASFRIFCTRMVEEVFHMGQIVKLVKLVERPGWRCYEKLGPTKRQEALRTLAEQTKKFDADHGTKLYDALLKNGFPAP
jgi:hypothetical protein